MMEQVPEAKSSLKNRSKSVDPYTLSSCHAVTIAPLVAIVAIKVRCQDWFPWKQSRRKSLRTYPARGIIRLSSAVSLMTTKGRESFFERNRAVYVTGSVSFRDELCRNSSKNDVEYFFHDNPTVRTVAPSSFPETEGQILKNACFEHVRRTQGRQVDTCAYALNNCTT